jgi:hypothetical protein
MIFGKQIMNIFSNRANPPKGAKKSIEREAKNRYRGPKEKKPRRETMKKITAPKRKKTSNKKKR